MGQKVKNYYQILNVAPVSSREEIEESYARARKMFEEDSVAIYSLYSEREKEEMLEDIIEAHEALIDPVKKDAYDARLAAYHRDTGVCEVENISSFNGGSAVRRASSEPAVEARTLRLRAPLVVTDDADPLATEQYRVLFTRLEHASLKHSHKVFAITSAVKGEGKTITSLHLAYVMARDFKKKVALVECDFKRPALLSYFSGLADNCGIVEALQGTAEIASALARLENSGLYLLPAVAGSRNSTELLGSQRMRSILGRLRTEFDYVIVDSPPVLPLADMNIIGKMVDGLVFVVRAGATPKDMVIKALKSLSNANISGLVLNGVDVSFKKNAYWNYGY
ncbi:MAG: polysaccharide biosynthesis tyrosine autokinase [Deltaproteobacteria bacterium]|nr:polysaccharide biosynthesis tyrosine autokinase [Deltaproteobacteria bacterium]